MSKTTTLVFAALILTVATCSGGGGGGGQAPAGGNLVPWAISDAGNLGAARNLLQIGDKFEATADPAAAAAAGDQIWGILRGARQWTGSNPLNTYQFFDDTNPNTNWGRAYRYTGFSVFAGPIRTPATIHGPGTYTAADGRKYRAVILQTWDDTYWQMIVIQDGTTLVHAHQHTNGLPVVETYRS